MEPQDSFSGTRPVAPQHAFDTARLKKWLSGRLPGFSGELLIEWLADNHVRMTGDWAESFRGEIDIAELERAVA